MRQGVQQLTRLSSSLKPDARVPDAGPDHLQLRHAVLPQRGQRALRRRLERHLAALHHPPEPERPSRGRSAPTTRSGPPRRPPTARSRTTTSTPTPIRTRRRPARRVSARPATSATATPSARRSSATSRVTRAPRPRASPRRRRARHEEGARSPDHRFPRRPDRDRADPRCGAYLGFTKDIPFTRPFELKAVFQNAPPIRPTARSGSRASTWARSRRSSRWAATRRACA